MKTEKYSIIVGQAIARCLVNNRRVAVPGMGSFVRREDGGAVIFSELARQDDNILTSHLADVLSTDRSEAFALTQNFASEVRRAVAAGKMFPVGDVGAFAAGANGRLTFIPNAPDAPSASQSASPERGAAAGGGRSEKSEERLPGSPATPNKMDDSYSPVRIGPEDVRDLQYQKPARVELIHERKGAKKRADKIMVVAIIAALLAIAAMIYGILNTPMPEFDLTDGVDNIESVE